MGFYLNTMQICAITIENFKSIKAPVRIELKPITLLFGPNSVGKSTVIQAFHYIREVISDPQRDVDRTKTGGEHVRLGGFANLVHNHDLNNTIRFRFELSIGEKDATIDDQFKDKDTVFDEILDSFPDDKERIRKYYREQLNKKHFPWLEIGIRRDSMDRPVYIKYTSIGFGDSPFLTIEANQEKDENEKEKIRIIHYLSCEDPGHPVLRKEHKEMIEALFKSDSNESAEKNENEITFDFDCSSFGTDSNLPNASFEYGYKEKLIDGELIRHQAPEKYRSLEKIFNTIWHLHVDTVKSDLDDFRYIGPMRQIPDETKFDVYDWRDPGNWADGLTAWYYLTHQANDWGVKEVNTWLSQQKFNTGYTIIRKQHKHLDIESDLYKKIMGASKLTDLQQIQKEINILPSYSALFFQSDNNDLLLKPKDIGVGVSQLLPIIPLVMQESFAKYPGLVAIEQPELHIHPAMQSVLGDLFIEGLAHELDIYGSKRFLLETHSEHLLLRLLRRLRDEGDLHNWIEPDELGIYFMEPSKDGVEVVRIRVNEEGEFKDPWPRGFFNERAQELF